MTDPRTLEDLYRHMEWADATVWRHVLDTPAAHDDDRLRELFHHIDLVQRGHHQGATGQPIEIPALDAFSDLHALYRFIRALYPSLGELYTSATEQTLAAPADVPWKDGAETFFGRPLATATLADLLTHLFTHAAHHRGQVNTRLRELGAKPPYVDYIIWVWLERPEPEWPEV
ncbi:MAG: DinB family protein [Acidobacteriota bacterium]